MHNITGYKQIYLNEMVKELGEEQTKRILSNFSCPLNKDVETFLRQKAIDFSKQGLAQTTLVFGSYKKELKLLGYYALANKTIIVPKKSISKTMSKRVSKFGSYNDMAKGYVISAPLIAQLGKNFSGDLDKVITGDELLQMACNKIIDIHRIMGGRFTYLECEDKPRLLDFYSRNGFVDFGKRKLDKDETDVMSGQYLVQMLKYLHDT